MKYFKPLVAIIFLILILFLLSKFYLPHFLSYKKHLESSNFLIEAWISSFEIEQAVADYRKYPESHFYIVGSLYPDLEIKQSRNDEFYESNEKKGNEGIWLYANSALNFLLPTELNLPKLDTVQIIVTAKGQEAGSYFAYFNLILNGECIGGAFSQKDYRQYVFNWIVPEEGLETCYVKFNNDLVVNNSDRNLNVESIGVDRHLLIADKGNTTIDRDLNNLTSGFGSQAEEAGNYLQQLGIDQKQITIINFKPAQRNQTLAAAKKFKYYISKSSISAINVITSNIHSRRTWLTYQRILSKETKVGVLYYSYPIPERIKELRKYPDLYYIMDEYLAYFANWIVLTF